MIFQGIHGVSAVSISDPKRLTDGTFHRCLTITSKDGRIELDLFGDEMINLFMHLPEDEKQGAANE